MKEWRVEKNWAHFYKKDGAYLARKFLDCRNKLRVLNKNLINTQHPQYQNLKYAPCSESVLNFVNFKRLRFKEAFWKGAKSKLQKCRGFAQR